MMKPTPDVLWVDDAATAYPADLYRFDGEADGVTGFAAAGNAAVAHFQRHGYLVIHHAFTAQEVAGALDEMLDLLAHPRPAFTGVQFEHPAPQEKLEEMAPELRQDHVRKFFNFVEFAPRMKALSEHPELLDVVSRVIGAAPALFQDMALLKPPRIGREKPWHQDHAYFDLPLDTPVVGVWIALDRAGTDNGCMTIIPGISPPRAGGPLPAPRLANLRHPRGQPRRPGGSPGAGRLPAVLQLHAPRHPDQHRRRAPPRPAVPLRPGRRRPYQQGTAHGGLRRRRQIRHLLTAKAGSAIPAPAFGSLASLPAHP